MINARGEMVAEKPSFRKAFAARRCLIVADGFYEWQKQGKTKQPYYICMQNSQPIALEAAIAAGEPHSYSQLALRNLARLKTRLDPFLGLAYSPPSRIKRARLSVREVSQGRDRLGPILSRLFKNSRRAAKSCG